MTTEIDITQQVTNDNYMEKFVFLKEIIVWLSSNLGKYLGYETNERTGTYLYAYGDNWQIKIYTPNQDHYNCDRYQWKVWIDNDILASVFILKFL